MPSDLDFPMRWLRLALTLAAGVTLATACAPLPRLAAPVEVPAAVLVTPPEPTPPLTVTVVITPAAPPDVLSPLLAYADRIRASSAPELALEIARLNDATQPADQLRLAMALVQTRQLYDLARAQDLLQKVLASNDDTARPLHPLARLLAARYAEQRRVEDQLDRQGQQLRDAQRRLDQTNDKLEALREIERSLTARPAGASAPASRARSGSTAP